MKKDNNPYWIKGYVKNGRLWSAVQATFKDINTQKAAAQALKLSPSTFSALLNMKVWPVDREGKWNHLARSIANALNETPEYLFSGIYYNMEESNRLDFTAGIVEWKTMAKFSGWPLKDFGRSSLKVAR